MKISCLEGVITYKTVVTCHKLFAILQVSMKGKKPDTAPEISKVVVGKPPKRGLARLRYVVLAVVLLCVISAVGIFFVQRNKSQSNSTATKTDITHQPLDTKESIFPQSKSTQEIQDQAYTFFQEGKPDQAQAVLDAAIAKTNNKIDKGSLYQTKAKLELNDQQKALQYAQEAENINPTSTTAALIAASAVALGQKELAIKYYQLELDRLTPAEKAAFGPTISQDIANLQGAQ